MKRKIFIAILILASISYNSVLAWNDTVTHPTISSKAVEYSSTNQYMKSALSLPLGIETKFNNKSVVEWLRYGAKQEDHPLCRASNHFHDPYKQWAVAWLTDEFWLLMFPACPFQGYPTWGIRSNLTWATGCLNQDCAAQGDIDSDSVSNNEWDWPSARQYFYTYLTGMDQSGALVALDQASRDTFLVHTLRALGQVMHLLQDSAVPAHVRNDFSQGHIMYTSGPGSKIGNLFEKYMQLNDGSPIFNLPPIKSNFEDPRLTDYWDTDAEVPYATTGTGLAEYASANFYSEYTIMSAERYANDTDNIHYFPYPRQSSLNIDEYDFSQRMPEEVFTTDGVTDLRLYIAKERDGEVVNHMAAWGYFSSSEILLMGA